MIPAQAAILDVVIAFADGAAPRARPNALDLRRAHLGL
ncbi:hypothetical protein PAAM106076_14600 [Paracoccus aminovorans]